MESKGTDMRAARLTLAVLLGLAGFGAGEAGREARVWQPPAGLRTMPIWPGPAPDQPAGPPESVTGDAQGVFDVSVPTLTIYPPRGPSKHAAIVVFPGGGFQMLAIGIEGTEICDWLTARGFTCILSKYRVPGTNDYWDSKLQRQITPKIPRALQDAQRTIRLTRAHAAQWGVDPHRIGVMGFSAGGYLVAQTSNILAPAYRPVDAVDRIGSRPDFAIAAYPGHLCKDEARPSIHLDPTIHVTRQTPPTFLLQAWDDPVDPICNSTLYARALDAAGVPAEVHLFAHGGHAFALRKKGEPVGVWPELVERWLAGSGMK